jgi:hypothetical protein
MLFLVREAGLEFQISGMYGIFETFIHKNAHFVSNIPIFPTDIFTLILLRVLVRVKIRVIFSPSLG